MVECAANHGATVMTDAAKLIALAHYLARKAVKEQLRARGFRPESFEPSVTSVATRAYLQAHLAELIAEAKAILCR
jgi:hypothetical protein